MEPDRIHPWRMGYTEESARLPIGCLFLRHIFELLLLHTANKSDKICKFHDPLTGTKKSDKTESTSNIFFSYHHLLFFTSKTFYYSIPGIHDGVLSNEETLLLFHDNYGLLPELWQLPLYHILFSIPLDANDNFL